MHAVNPPHSRWLRCSSQELCGRYARPDSDRNASFGGKGRVKAEAGGWGRPPRARCRPPPTHRAGGGGKRRARPCGRQAGPSANETPRSREVSRPRAATRRRVEMAPAGNRAVWPSCWERGWAVGAGPLRPGRRLRGPPGPSASPCRWVVCAFGGGILDRMWLLLV